MTGPLSTEVSMKCRPTLPVFVIAMLVTIPWTSGQKTSPDNQVATSPVYRLPNGDEVRLETFLEPLPEEISLRLGVRNVGFEKIVIRSQHTTENTIYRSPSSPYATSVDYHRDKVTALVTNEEPMSDTSAPYGHLKALIYENMVLRSPSGEKT